MLFSSSILALSIFALISAIQVITSANAVHAVFFLVLVFIVTSVFRLVLSREFRALVFLRVYVGAIAVLFLFVVRRLNISSTNNLVSERPRGNIPRRILLGSTFFWVIGENAITRYPSSGEILLDLAQPGDFRAEPISSRNAIGQLMYTTYIVEFLVAGLVLLVAMVGAIILTLSSSRNSQSDNYVNTAEENLQPIVPVLSRGQHVHEQHSRDSDSAIFLVK